MPFGYKLVPVDLYDLMLAKLREPVFQPWEASEPEPSHDTLDDAEVTAALAKLRKQAEAISKMLDPLPVEPTPAPLPDPADVLVALDNGQTVGVPSVVVNACIHEARGNDVVLERQLIIAARQIALGMDPQHVAMQMRAGEQVEV